MKLLVLLLALITVPTYASDPSVSVYQQTIKNSSLNKQAYNLTEAEAAGTTPRLHKWAFFTFGDTDKLLGSIVVENSSATQTVKFNAVNYYLWFGGKYYLPFQLYLTQNAPKENTASSTNDSNTSKLVDPESGIAIKFPLLWIYQSNGDGICAFLSSTNTIGHCAVGGDVTLNFKDLKNQSGSTNTAFGRTLRVGASLLFPVLSEKKDSEQGYVSAAGRIVYARTNAADPNNLFTPVLDTYGQPIPFEESIFASELEFKWRFYDKLSIGAKWLKPINNKQYLSDLFKMSLETQF